MTLPLDRESLVRAVLTDACFSQWWDAPFDVAGLRGELPPP